MKTSFIVLLPLLIMLATLQTYGKSKDPKKEAVVKWVKNQVVYFKVTKEFVGGTVEVYDSNNQFLECEDLPHTLTMIYFDGAPEGQYTIRVKKGDKMVELTYNNAPLFNTLEK